MQQQYFLARHAFVCSIGADVIVLDLKQDRYLWFERTFWEPIARLIGQGFASESQSPAEDAPDETALAQLLESGLLTEDSSQGKDVAPPAIELPSASMMEDFRARRPAIRPGHVTVFLRAIFTAWLRLRCRPLEKIVGDVGRERQRHGQAVDLGQLRDLTEIFRRLRPMVFTAHDHCLFESLTLIHFLAHYRIHPHWVFGVQTSPFIAHCWLQQGEVACNDILDRIRRYTPIMLA
jgi:hypothetical protein